MDGLDSGRAGRQRPAGSPGGTPPAGSAPALVTDVLYLIAAHHGDTLGPSTAQELSRANLSFIRGDLPAALASTDTVLRDLDATRPGYADILALRLLLGSLTGREPEGMPDGGAEPGAPRVVSLCVRARRHWHGGSLFQGLLLNQSALQHAHDVAPLWRVHPRLQLAGQLSDIHVRQQASWTITQAQRLMDDSGLHALDPVPEALRAALHLQRGRYESALESAGTALHLAEARATAVGVTLARSVAAMAHLGLGRPDDAAAALKSCRAEASAYCLPHTAARVTLAEAALLAADRGARAAARLIRSEWHQLGTRSACFVEDVARPAWLVALARRAGDTGLAERCLAAVERLTTNNPEVPVLQTAARYARAAFAGERSRAGRPQSPLDLGAGPRPFSTGGGPSDPGTATAGPPRPAPGPKRPPASPASSPPGPVAHRGQPGTPAQGSTGQVPAARAAERVLKRLSRRECEVARLVGSGLTNKQVAHVLGLSPHTVNFHLRSVFRKLAISTRVSLGRIVAQLDQQPGTSNRAAAGGDEPARPG